MAYHEHPFVKGIADGSLDKEKFKYYMIQDYLYLIDYTKVFALGAAKAKDLVMPCSLFAGYTHCDSGWGDGYPQSLYGTSWASHQEEAETDTMSHLITFPILLICFSVAYEEGAPEAAAAILSCAVSYEVDCEENRSRQIRMPTNHPFYGEWIRGYACRVLTTRKMKCL